MVRKLRRFWWRDGIKRAASTIDQVMEKIFCVGFPKTGTSSLEKALEILGRKVCRGSYASKHTNYLVALYLNNDFEQIKKFVSYYDAFADIPWGGTALYKDLAQAYPDARFIITTRKPESWFRSFTGMIMKLDEDPRTALETFAREGRYGAEYYFRKTFGITDMRDVREKVIARYRELNEELLSYFEQSGLNYLKLEICGGQGWEELCGFLGEEIPEVPFPHSNKGVKRSGAAEPGDEGGLFGIKKVLKHWGR